MMIPAWPKRIDSGHGEVTSEMAEKWVLKRQNLTTFLARHGGGRKCSGVGSDAEDAAESIKGRGARG